MKTVVAVIATAIVCAGGAHAYDASVTPAQFAALKARVTALENFRNNCLFRYRVHLIENSSGNMVWSTGQASLHGARFYAIPDTATPSPYC